MKTDKTFSSARPPAAPCPHTAAKLGYIHRAKDIETVFTTIAGQCIALRDFLADARAELENTGGVVRAGNDLFMAQHLVSLIGSLADEMSKTPVLGNPTAWATMDGIERIGGAT
ncbi:MULTISPECIES: hypothetical protein [Comamonas]|uniref:hypothetical protein n=1 Tax=Comamonas TaxID=283 RepID=UPI0012CDD174|nr:MULTISPECIES: hypothetical protein [Comamonas]MPS96194.1 hypothetical protein [Comamonas sp.]UUE92491.1 hypothetical protein MJ608_16240 [Comamonas thiooxydans]